MRVVSGIAKGRKLKAPKTPGTRPVMDRVKTALFDILSGDVRDSRMLDLFAGTGGIGIEALSRGAASVTFIELGAEALRCVQENLAITGLARNAEVLRADAFQFLEQAAANGRRYDIIYVAPPQYKGMAARALTQLDAAPLTDPGGLVIAQIDPRERTTLDTLALTRLRPVDERRYGSTLLIFYEHAEELRAGATEDQPAPASEE
ncbi:MAG: 16S rRNA (guanine(966)-N(2))-methyltransferase [Ktedonobacterales bacterium]|jgi:16S rRNA (guanine(966)-N(2))-methyltransferase RsmD|nr:MAG: 16S rRNA (guanine(966)-N(2))-methyltransferase [Ktedonobacterales bacterium]